MLYPAPSHLANITTEVNKDILSHIQESYGDNTTAFKLIPKFVSLSQTWVEEEQAHGSTIWATDSKGNRTIIFDPSKHGYNGVMQLNQEENLDSVKSVDLPNGAEIIVAFQYGGDEAGFTEDGPSKYPQDYFGWVIVYKYLGNKLEEVLSYECS
jgi:hypothetical protein